MGLMRRLLRSGVEHVGLFRSHDVTSLETPRTEAGRKKLAYWESLGVQVIDGESSAMLVIASVLKLKAASLALISENYSSGESLQVEEAQRKTLFQTAARALCLRCGGSL
jgi:purine-nucleoside phosphorylase